MTRGRRASCSAKPPPLPAGRAHGAYKTVRNTGWREKTRPARLLHRHFREKTRPTRLKTAFFAHFGLAGRTFSRSHPPSGRAGRTFSRPAWQVLEVETLKATTHIHAVHMKPPARLLTSGSSLLKPTAPKRACPSAPPASKDVQERIVSDLEAKLRRLDEAESATSEALGRLTDLRYRLVSIATYGKLAIPPRMYYCLNLHKASRSLLSTLRKRHSRPNFSPDWRCDDGFPVRCFA